MTSNKMKAIVYKKYGPPDVLKLKEVEKPTPKDNEVLIKIHAVTVNTGDCEMRRVKIPNFIWFLVRLYFGLFKPRKRIQILGVYLAGEIEKVGSEIKQFRKGDQIFASTGPRFGGYAEYICLPIKYAMVIKPKNMTYEEAATVPLGGLNSLHYLRKGKIKKGDKILINGAGGSFGTFAIQLAKYFGANVTAVDSTKKMKMLRSIGADKVIDYTKEDFTKSGETYDIIFDVVGKSSFSDSLKSLNKNGRYIIANPQGMLQLIRGFWNSVTSNKKVIFEFADEKTEDLIFLKKIIEDGKIKSVIDRRFPLEKAVEAHRYVESGYKKGNVVITMEHSNKT